MIEIKLFILTMMIGTSTLIGFRLARKYKERLKELKDLRFAMSVFETKMKLTKEPIPVIFREITNQIEGNIAKIFENAADHMEYTTAGNAWNESLTITKTNLNTEDLEMLKTFGKMLGKTGVEGQVKEIQLTNILIDEQTEDARIKKSKNGKMYQSLGVLSGIALFIILI